MLVVVAAWVLASVRPDRPNTPSQPHVPDAKAGNKKIGPNDKVIMHINGEPVTESDFNTFAQSAPAEQRDFYGSPDGRRLLADELVKLKTLEQEGRRLGVDKDPEVRAQLDALSSQIVAGKALEKLVKENMDQKIKAAYEKEKGKAKTLRHILIAYRGSQFPAKSGEAPSAEQATQKATALIARLRGGADFAQIAQAESDDQQTAQRGGIIGPVSPEQLPPSMATVVNSLQAGQISDPVRTEYGIHIFKVESPSLEDMRPVLEQRVQREALEETVTRLQKGAKVEYNETFFGKPKPAAAPAPPAPKSNG